MTKANPPRNIYFGKQFKCDLKKNFLNTATLAWAEVIHNLAQDLMLTENYRDHALTGNWIGFRECHIKPDLLLIYEKPDESSLVLVRLGSHSELFD